MKLTRVLSLKTFNDEKETTVILKEGGTLWKKRMEVPSVMIAYGFSFSRVRLRLVKFSLIGFLLVSIKVYFGGFRVGMSKTSNNYR